MAVIGNFAIAISRTSDVRRLKQCGQQMTDDDPFLDDRLQNGLPYAIGPLSVCPVLSVLSVCEVGVLWPNGLTYQDATWQEGRARPRRHCVR